MNKEFIRKSPFNSPFAKGGEQSKATGDALMAILKAAVLLEDHYETLEAWYPYLRLREEGIDTLFIGPGRGKYEGKFGYPANEELNIRDAKASDFAAVIVPGGYAPDLMRRSKETLAFVRKMYDEEKLVAAICHAGWILISAGIIKGKQATSFYAIRDDMVNAGALWVDKEVVVDGNIITSRNPYDLPYFCAEIIKWLKE